MINTCLPTFKMEDKPSIFNFNKPETNTNSTSDPATKSLF